MKWKAYPVAGIAIVATALLVVGLALTVGRYRVEIVTESAEPATKAAPSAAGENGERSPLAPPTLPSPQPIPTASSPSAEKPTTSPPDSTNPTAIADSAEPNTTASKTNNPSTATRPGGLRLSNQTGYPVRVVLLAKQLKPASPKLANATTNPNYEEPAHWDFAPEEGGSRGLLLSLPEGKLVLRKGDILVAFAQDGSRRYWGPFVVGETASPVWNSQTAEWLLVLQP